MYLIKHNNYNKFFFKKAVAKYSLNLTTALTLLHNKDKNSTVIYFKLLILVMALLH